jgi:hypothetical protein
MATLRARLEAKVDRSAEHHLWTGSKKADGIRKMKVDSKAVTAQRIAWERVHGRLPPELKCWRVQRSEPACGSSISLFGDRRVGVVAGPGVAGREGAARRSRSGLACGS